MNTEADIPASSLGGLRILLVEDEAMVAMLMEGMLDGLGCQRVEWVASVPAALDALERGEFDGALLDVNLSGTTVYPVAAALAGRKLPFVFVTGYGRTAELHARFPHAAVLKKPFDSGDLASVIKKEISLASKR
jgi:CheY-like chemotaxis protein